MSLRVQVPSCALNYIIFMKILLSWLNEFINIKSKDINSVLKNLTSIGFEVSNITPKYKFNIPATIVVGHVISCQKHPNADKLYCTKVDIGSKILDIVCGAPNIKTGLNVVVAQEGSTIYSYSGESIKIKNRKIRGQESYGMICAEDEIGISEQHDQIIEVDIKYHKGTKVSDIYNKIEDYILDVDITPNRCYALSHFGFAHDIKAIYTDINITLPKVQNNIQNKLSNFNVNIKPYDLCSHYCGVLVKNVHITSSPSWLQERLKSVGIKTINNVVDITNYIMFSYGQPLHAYDFDKINGGIHVVTSTPNSTFLALDKKQYTLEDDIIIADYSNNILSLGGIIGGQNTAIHSSTKNIFFESANFDIKKIRHTTHRLGIQTEAAYRFSRGIDEDLTFFSLLQAVDMLTQQQQNIVIEGYIEEGNIQKKNKITLSYDYIQNKIGVNIALDYIMQICKKLDIEIIGQRKQNNDTILTCEIPRYRTNIQNRDDIVDEILRINCFDIVTLKNYKYKFAKDIECDNNVFRQHDFEKKISNILCANGFFEIITNPLISHDYIYKNNDDIIHILNSTITKDTLRDNMIYSMLEVIQHNIHNGNKSLRLFEFGKTYCKSVGGYTETNHLAIAITGEWEKDWWHNEIKDPFFYIKENIYLLLNSFKIENLNEKIIHDEHYGRCIEILYHNAAICRYGIVNNTILSKFDLEEQVFFADIYIHDIFNIIDKKEIDIYTHIANYPIVKRDMSFVFKKDIPFEDIKNVINNIGIKEIMEYKLFDVFMDNNKLGKDLKVYSFTFYLQSQLGTMKDKEIKSIMNKIITIMQETFDAKLKM